MIIDCISDLHGYFPELDGGDLLIVAGDLTASDEKEQHIEFFSWLKKQKYRQIIFIAGNHDNKIQNRVVIYSKNRNVRYLEDSGMQFEGLKIWGTPWTSTFEGMNPHCKAFTCDTEEELAEKWVLIPDDTDILVTHCPPNGIMDGVKDMSYGFENLYTRYTGSVSLRNHSMKRIKPKLHVFGHIHEWGGKCIDTCVTKFVNASIVNEFYQPVNKPVRVIL